MIVEVAAAVLLRPDGAFLLARRPQGKAYAGYWEFPGGKVEPGEPPEQALRRELREELGVEVERAYPWITRVFAYPHATVRLSFFRVAAWRNDPHPRENQAISWQPPGTPGLEPMLPANAPVLAALSLPHEYAITDAATLGLTTMLSRLEAGLQAGLKLLQVREPHLAEAERARFTAQAIEAAHRHGCRVMVKAPYEGADGIHYTAVELMKLGKRPAGMLAAASCHTREELERAMRLELDFAVLGPVRRSGDKQGIGWDRFAALAAGSSIPLYAIGGLSRADLEDAWRSGAHGVAMIRGSWA